jgi:hypothetical protein
MFAKNISRLLAEGRIAVLNLGIMLTFTSLYNVHQQLITAAHQMWASRMFPHGKASLSSTQKREKQGQYLFVHHLQALLFGSSMQDIYLEITGANSIFACSYYKNESVPRCKVSYVDFRLHYDTKLGYVADV